MGSIEVICGCMYSGKTEELIRRLRRSLFAHQKIRLFNPLCDSRYHKSDIVTHYGEKLEGFSVENAAQIFDMSKEMDVIAIDEAQFFSDSIIEVVEVLAKSKRVIVSGLDQDFEGKPFGPMGKLLCVASKVTKLKAVCTICGEDASKTQRTSNSTRLVKIGSYGEYEARCPKHWTGGGNADL